MNAVAPTVLLVEDDANDVLLVQRAFRKAGAAPPSRVVGDGDAAVAYMSGEGSFADRRENPLPALVLLDLKLPRRSGLEVLAWRAGRPDLRRVPVVVLTSSTQAADLERAYELGANSYLAKPVSLDGLVEVARALDLYWLHLNRTPNPEG